jgi:hypothetical protein
VTKNDVRARARGRLTLLPWSLAVPLCTVRIEHPAARRWVAVRSRLRRPAGRFTVHAEVRVGRIRHSDAMQGVRISSIMTIPDLVLYCSY